MEYISELATQFIAQGGGWNFSLARRRADLIQGDACNIFMHGASNFAVLIDQAVNALSTQLPPSPILQCSTTIPIKLYI